METFGIIGMIFGLGAMGIVYELKRTDKHGNINVEELKEKAEKYKDNLAALMITRSDSLKIYRLTVSQSSILKKA